MGTILDESLCFDVTRLRTEPARLVVEDCVRDFLSKDMCLKDYAVYSNVSYDYIRRLFTVILPHLNNSLYVEYLHYQGMPCGEYLDSLSIHRSQYRSAILLYIQSDLSLINCAKQFNVAPESLRAYIYVKLPMTDLGLFKYFLNSKFSKGATNVLPEFKEDLSAIQLSMYDRCLDIADLALNQGYTVKELLKHFSMSRTNFYRSLGSYLATYDFDLYERVICHLKTAEDLELKKKCKSVGYSIINGDSIDSLARLLKVTKSHIHKLVDLLIRYDYDLYLNVISVLDWYNRLDLAYIEYKTNTIEEE